MNWKLFVPLLWMRNVGFEKGEHVEAALLIRFEPRLTFWDSEPLSYIWTIEYYTYATHWQSQWVGPQTYFTYTVNHGLSHSRSRWHLGGDSRLYPDISPQPVLYRHGSTFHSLSFCRITPASFLPMLQPDSKVRARPLCGRLKCLPGFKWTLLYYYILYPLFFPLLTSRSIKG